MCADKASNLSICRDERIIYIYRPADGLADPFSGMPEKQKHLTKKLESKIGGAFGIGANVMTANISL